MYKQAGSALSVSFEITGYYLHGYSFHQEDPNNINTARLEAVYSLVGTEDGVTVLSPNPMHQHIRIKVFNVGNYVPLTEFLETSGACLVDLYDFSYRDVQRLVEADVKEKFGLEV